MNFAKLGEYLDSLVDSKLIPGVDIIVSKDHKQLYRHMNGLADRENNKPITSDTLYYIYSASKPITVAAALTLFEKGGFLLNDKLCDYLPEFSELKVKEPDGKLRDAKCPILIKDLFRMTCQLRNRQ